MQRLIGPLSVIGQRHAGCLQKALASCRASEKAWRRIAPISGRLQTFAKSVQALADKLREMVQGCRTAPAAGQQACEEEYRSKVHQ